MNFSFFFPWNPGANRFISISMNAGQARCLKQNYCGRQDNAISN